LLHGGGLMIQNHTVVGELDHEWVELMRIANEMGISIQEIKEFLGCHSSKRC
jgi:hypothetical protein